MKRKTIIALFCAFGFITLFAGCDSEVPKEELITLVNAVYDFDLDTAKQYSFEEEHDYLSYQIRKGKAASKENWERIEAQRRKVLYRLKNELRLTVENNQLYMTQVHPEERICIGERKGDRWLFRANAIIENCRRSSF